MAITKVTSGLISADASSIDLNIDAGTLYLDVSENRVGIGTTSPSQPLTVSKAGDLYIQVNNSSAGFNTYLGTYTNESRIVCDDAKPIAFFVNGSRVVDFANGGNVGIGTSNPTGGKLHVVGNVFAESGSFYVGGGGVVASDSTSRDLNFAIGNTTPKMTLDTSGNVGIGNSSPSSFNQRVNAPHLVVGSGNNSSGLTVYSGSSNQGSINFADGTTTTQQYEGGLVYSHASNDMSFHTNGGVERMRIDASYNLLLGKTSAGIDASGAIIKPSGDYYATVASGINTYHVYDTTNNLYTFYVGSNGGISNFSTNNVNLSDEREKKNVEVLPSQWDCLKHWDLKQFHYNADDDALPKKYGVIAQEIEAHCPEVIDVFKVDEDTERMGVKEQQMMWMAIKALQEAQTRIESLEARIAALES